MAELQQALAPVVLLFVAARTPMGVALLVGWRLLARREGLPGRPEAISG